MARTAWYLLVFSLLLGAVVCQEKNLKTLVKGLRASDDVTRKESLEALEKKAAYGVHAVNEIYERDAVPALVKLLEEEYTNPLNKELAVSVLSSIQKERNNHGTRAYSLNFATPFSTWQAVSNHSFSFFRPSASLPPSSSPHFMSPSFLFLLRPIANSEISATATSTSVHSAVHQVQQFMSMHVNSFQHRSIHVTSLSLSPLHPLLSSIPFYSLVSMTIRIQRASLAASPALDAFVYALKSGTPTARERAAALVVDFSQDETARRRFTELNVLALLQRVTEIGNPSAKRHAVTAIRKLQHPIEPTSSTATSSTATSSTSPSPTPHDHLHEQPPSFKPAEHWLKGLTNDYKQGPPKKKNSFVNNYRLRAPSRASHI